MMKARCCFTLGSSHIYGAFESFLHFLGPAVNMLRYSDKNSDVPVKKSSYSNP